METAVDLCCTADRRSVDTGPCPFIIRFHGRGERIVTATQVRRWSSIKGLSVGASTYRTYRRTVDIPVISAIAGLMDDLVDTRQARTRRPTGIATLCSGHRAAMSAAIGLIQTRIRNTDRGNK